MRHIKIQFCFVVRNFKPKIKNQNKCHLTRDLKWEITRAALILKPKTKPKPLFISLSLSLSPNQSSHGSHTQRLCSAQSSRFHVPKRHFPLRKTLCRVPIRGTFLHLLFTLFLLLPVCLVTEKSQERKNEDGKFEMKFSLLLVLHGDPGEHYRFYHHDRCFVLLNQRLR